MDHLGHEAVAELEVLAQQHVERHGEPEHEGVDGH
jgi:hypothetical protein